MTAFREGLKMTKRDHKIILRHSYIDGSFQFVRPLHMYTCMKKTFSDEAYMNETRGFTQLHGQ